MAIAITRKRLRQWATKQAPGVIIGRSQSIDSCPIATYILAKGGADPYVGDRNIRFIDPSTKQRVARSIAPDLAEVIHTVDHKFLGPVNREGFLDVLDMVDRIFGG